MATSTPAAEVAPTSGSPCTQGWHEVPLASLARVRFSGVDKKSRPGERQVRLCNYTDVYNNDYITLDLPFMAATATAAEIEAFGLKPGDVIITKDSETPDDIGIPALVDQSSPDLVCGYHLALIRPKGDMVDATFLAKQVSQHQVAKYFGQQANGLTRYGLPNSAVERTPIRLPICLREQQIIGQILRDVDSAIRDTEAVLVKLRYVKMGFLHDVLTCGVDAQGQLRDPLRAPQSFQDSPLGRIPAEWSVEPFGALLTDIEAGHSPSCPNISAPAGEWGVLKVSAVTQEGFVPSENKQIMNLPDVDEACEIETGDLLMTRCNTPELVGAACIVDETPPRLMLCDKTFRLSVDSGRDERRFLVHVLRMSAVRRQIEISATGSSGSMKNISQSDIRGYIVPRPPADEQRRIARKIDGLLCLAKAEQVALAKLQWIKAGLTSDLLTGRIRVKV